MNIASNSPHYKFLLLFSYLNYRANRLLSHQVGATYYGPADRN